MKLAMESLGEAQKIWLGIFVGALLALWNLINPAMLLLAVVTAWVFCELIKILLRVFYRRNDETL